MGRKQQSRQTSVDRRTFVAGMGAAGLIAATPTLAKSYQENSKLDVGLIGCGGRGNWITKLFQDTGKYQWVACSDYYQDRVDATGRIRHAECSGRNATTSIKLR